MKMSKRVEKALRASIKHWEGDVLEDNKYPGNSNCPMCKLMKHKDKYGHNCSQCILDPICNSQYQDYIEGINGYDSTRKKLARMVIRAMQDLLPK